MKKILLGAAVMAMGAGAALAQDVVRLGTEGAYPPYNYIDDSGEVAGFERVLGDELCKRAELTCEWVTNDWDSIIPNLVSGNYDAIIAGMSITPEREEVVAFTQNYTPPSPSAFASMMDGIDLETAVIAAQTGTIQAAHVATMEGATLVEYPTPDETVAAMRSGEADAVLSDKDYLIPVVEESSDVSFVGDDVPLGGGIGMAFRQSDPELRETFDAAIQSMKDDGTLNELIVEYLGADSPKF